MFSLTAVWPRNTIININDFYNIRLPIGDYVTALLTSSLSSEAGEISDMAISQTYCHYISSLSCLKQIN